MSYFPYAFQPLLLATAGIVETAGTPSLALTAAQLGVMNARTNLSVALGAGTTAQNTPKVYLAQGSMSAQDNLGGVVIQSVGSAGGTPFHGGYKASRKSREIDPKHITKFYFVGATAQTKAAVSVTVVGTDADFENNQSLNGGPHLPAPEQDGSLRRQEVYRLRVDLKGSPILRALNRNEYWHFDASTMCMPDGNIDQAALVTQWKDAINAHPIIAKFVTATNASPLVLVITDTYTDTVFNDPVYSRNDFHEREGIQIFTSVVDERQMTCNGDLFTYQEISVSKQGTGFGETVLQEMILENEYRQEPWHEDTRLRAVLDDTNLASIDRTRKYGAYYLQYSVQRRSNSSSLQDDDQILLKIITAPLGAGVQAGGTRSAAFETFVQAYAASAGNTVVFQDLTSVLTA